MRPKVDENGWLVPLHQDSKAYLVYCLLKQGTTPRLYSQMVWRITHPDKAHRHKYTPRPKQPRALRPITNTILDLWVDGLSMKAIIVAQSMPNKGTRFVIKFERIDENNEVDISTDGVFTKE